MQTGSDINGQAADDLSGRAVSLSADGETVAIGAPLNDDNGNNSGQVRVYRLAGGVWLQQGANINGEAAGDESGFSVCLSADGQTVAIGEHNNGDNGTLSGQVRVFRLVGGVWTQQGADINGEAAFDQFGYSVSLSADGQIIAIGAIEHDYNGINNRGRVQVYQFTGGAWTKQGADIDGEGAADWSGWSVSLSADGQIVAIGAPRNSGNGSQSGHVRVYKLIGGVWTQQGADIDGKAAGDESGISVSLSADGQTVAIGAKGNDDNGGDSGHARVFKFAGGVWTQQGTDINGEAANDFSGISVSLSSDGRTVAIGAFGNDGNGSQSGHVRVYKLAGGVWMQQGPDIEGKAAGDESGWSVSLSSNGQTLAIGATGNGSGHVRVFQLIPPPQFTILSNGNPIDNRSYVPSPANGTDFGAVPVGSPVSQTFTLGNTSTTVPLILTGAPLVTIAGLNASDFTVVTQPATPIPPGGSVNFTVEFNPGGPGFRWAIIIVTHTDLPHNPLVFMIQGIGL